jgi:hypothetical protein
MYPIEQYQWNTLPPSLGYQIASFMRIVWLNDLKGEDRFWEFFSSPEVVAHFTISERDVLISHALVRRRIIEHLGKSYVVYGVGAVMTYPAFRREGYARRIVDATTDFIRQSDADLGMLFTGLDLHPWYGKSGWSTLNREGVYAGDPQHPDYVDAHSMILPVSEKGKACREDFERGNLYVGDFTW